MKIVISFDFELGWGVLDNDDWYIRQQEGVYDRLRSIIPTLIKKLKDTEIATTWGVVGSMFLHNNVQLEHLPLQYRDKAYHFLQNSKRTTHNALDLVEHFNSIQDIVEFGSHTSTHIYVSHPGVTSKEYIDDVNLSFRQIPEEFKSKKPILIFSRDEAKFRHEVSQEIPSLIYRVNPRILYKNKFQKNIYFGMGRLISDPRPSKIVNGIFGETIHSGSFYFNYVGEKYEILKKHFFKKDLNYLIDNSVNKTYHIWLHPFNLAQSKELFDTFLLFLEDLAKLRDTGKLTIDKMSDIKV